MKIFAWVFAAVLVCTSAYAADKKGNFQILGAGAVTCDKYLEANKEALVYAETWWAGYVTAVDRLTDDTWAILGDNSVEDINKLIRKECQNNTTELFAIAVHNVLDSIYKGRARVDPNK